MKKSAHSIKEIADQVALVMELLDDGQHPHEEYEKFARLFVLAKFGLKVQQANLVMKYSEQEHETDETSAPSEAALSATERET